MTSLRRPYPAALSPFAQVLCPFMVAMWPWQLWAVRWGGGGARRGPFSEEWDALHLGWVGGGAAAARSRVH